MSTRVEILTTSQVKCFKQCRRRYELEYVLGLKPIETPKALAIGTMYHRGIELLLLGEQLDKILLLVQTEAEIDAQQKEIDCDYYAVYTALEMITAFNRSAHWRSWNLVAVEKEFCVSTGYAKRLAGKIDAIMIKDDKSFLVEHKTTSQWGTDGSEYIHNLLWDEQPTNYLYAHQRMQEDGVIDGSSACGIFYSIIEKPTLKPYAATPTEKRKYTKDGRLRADQHEQDETPSEFRQRVAAWYAKTDRVHEAYVYRSDRDVQMHIEDFNAVLRDIVHAEKEQIFYRNPESCKTFPCPYRCKCLENVPETDCLFVKKQKRNEELNAKH